jgi:hypothetical protein
MKASKSQLRSEKRVVQLILCWTVRQINTEGISHADRQRHSLILSDIIPRWNRKEKAHSLEAKASHYREPCAQPVPDEGSAVDRNVVTLYTARANNNSDNSIPGGARREYSRVAYLDNQPPRTKRHARINLHGRTFHRSEVT